ncbi:hypothetical protein DBR06_SOUSAS11410023, partial [Sousa chinensis]
LPLQDVANGDLGTIRVHVPFPMSDLSHVQGKPGSFSQDPSMFIREFQALTIAFDLTWPDIPVVLSTCCTHEGKARIGALAQAWADETYARNPNENRAGAEAVPRADPGWRHPANENGPAGGPTRRNYMITCLLEGMKKAIIKPVNYKKPREVTQEPSENPALFPARLAEPMRKYSSVDPETPEGQAILAVHFISQASPDIRQK